MTFSICNLGSRYPYFNRAYVVSGGFGCPYLYTMLSRKCRNLQELSIRFLSCFLVSEYGIGNHSFFVDGTRFGKKSSSSPEKEIVTNGQSKVTADTPRSTMLTQGRRSLRGKGGTAPLFLVDFNNITLKNAIFKINIKVSPPLFFRTQVTVPPVF